MVTVPTPRLRQRNSFYKGVSSDYAFCRGHVEILYSVTERREDINTATWICSYALVGYFGL